MSRATRAFQNLSTERDGRTVNISGRVLDAAVRSNGAVAVLSSGLLHEQAHVEGDLGGHGVPDSDDGRWRIENGIESYEIPDNIHLGWRTDQVIFDGALYLYGPQTDERVFWSAAAFVDSERQQIAAIRRGAKRFQHWFGPLNGAVGSVYDAKNHLVYHVDASSGKRVQTPNDEMRDLARKAYHP